MNQETEKILIEILAKLHTLPNPVSIPWDDLLKQEKYEKGYYEALRDARHIVKEYILEDK